LACWEFSTALLPFSLFAVFALYERKNVKQLIETYHAAAGETCSIGYPLADAKQRKCVSPTMIESGKAGRQMDRSNAMIRWAAKVPQWKIRRLYETDARGIIDDERIDEVGWALWERCDSILTVTAAHHGLVRCLACGNDIERQQNPPADESIICGACGWQISWQTYHQSYRGKQLFGANAVDVFKAYHQAFPQAQGASARMLLIDQLIHAFHVALTEIGRPAAANLIEGSLAEVIQFLDTLTSSGASATGVGASQPAWRRTLASAPWAQQFINRDTDSEG
jgi:hypothetical protein